MVEGHHSWAACQGELVAASEMGQEEVEPWGVDSAHLAVARINNF